MKCFIQQDKAVTLIQKPRFRDWGKCWALDYLVHLTVGSISNNLNELKDASRILKVEKKMKLLRDQRHSIDGERN